VNSAYQLVGLTAVVVGLVGTWLAARRRSGWLLCIASSTMWLPALITGDQWAAVLNCGLSMAICIRNFRTQESPGNIAVGDPAHAVGSG
jgi:hypothetical protein